MYRYLITASCDLLFCKVSFLNLPNADKISNFVKNSAKKLRAYCLRMVLKVYNYSLWYSRIGGCHFHTGD